MRLRNQCRLTACYDTFAYILMPLNITDDKIAGSLQAFIHLEIQPFLHI
jgi:hypothetical protein